ncbi:DegT/DnrJ/EryC1/StrS family aminotransferase [Streptomyces sp. NPDC059786]|uniref:DegT/DnrJ/EryC1/StrS family aminotransferase n=1 Tax=Streptomyces sp. NPDC059786 TaxID=3346946 RepID=UPI00364F808E
MQIHHLRRLLDTAPRYDTAPRHDSGSEGAADRARRVRATVARLARAEPAPLRVTGTAVAVRDGLRRERLTLHSPVRGEFGATVLAPEDGGPCPAVLVLGGKNARPDQLTGEVAPDHPDRNVAERLARAGFTTLAFEYAIGGGLEPGRLAGRDEGALLAHAFALTGRSLLGALTGDALGALDVLRGHPLADPGRLGLFGHSLGAAVALHTALLSGTPLPLCAAGHLGSYPALYARLLTGFEGAALPGILEYTDLPGLYAALAPAPLQLQYGTEDPFLETADARAAGHAVTTAYEAADAPRPEVLEIAMGHGTHVGHAVDFFTRELAPSRIGAPPPVPAQRIRFDVAERRRVLDRVDAALDTGVLTQGPLVARFEELSRAWTATPGAAVASGSAALEIALRIIGVTGRTVLVPANTFFATAAAAVRAGAARVRFADLELDGLGMDPDALRTALDRYPDTAAVVPVHIGGIVAPSLDGVLEQCRERGIPVLEDAAHAFGSALGDRPAGSLGRFGAFSFFPTKVATSGEGGLLTGRDGGDLEHVRRWRDHGRSAPGSTLHDRPGSNWRMSELHAAVGTVDLERFAVTLAARRERAAHYDDLLAGVPRLRPHTVPGGTHSNYYKYLVHLDEPADRALLKKRLRERHGVRLAGEVYDHLLCDHPYFADAAADGSGGADTGTEPDGPYPRARRFARHHIALPLHPSLTHDEQIRVVTALRGELS